MINMCKVENCNNKILAKGYCSKHYSQIRKFGEIQLRTVNDKNNIEIIDNIAYIDLYNRNNEVIAKAIIDVEDIDKIKNHKWKARNNRNTNYYCDSNSAGQLHRFILNLNKDNLEIVDHINGNTLDNRKENLRLCTNQENIRNCKVPKNNKSGHKGVYWCESRNKWSAQITIDNKTIALGRFDNIEDAIKCRNEASLKHYGEFSRE